MSHSVAIAYLGVVNIMAKRCHPLYRDFPLKISALDLGVSAP